MSEEISGFSLDNGPLNASVQRLLLTSTVAQWIQIVQLDKTTGYRVVGLPVGAWSTGEQLLWRFAVSVAGRGRINLHDFMAYMRHSGLREQIFEVLELGLDPIQRRGEKIV